MGGADIQTSNPEPQKTKSILTNPTTSGGWNLLKTAKSLRFFEDPDGNIWTVPVVITDPSSGALAPANTTTFVGNDSNTSGNALEVASVTYLFNVPNGSPERLRTMSKIQTAGFATLAATAVWTPAAGKKFRLMGFTCDVGNDVTPTAAGSLLIALNDGATKIYQVDLFLTAAQAATTVPLHVVVNLPGNGYLSQTINNTLNVTLSGGAPPLTAGTGYITSWGTEE